jgi:hypothetical protein
MNWQDTPAFVLQHDRLNIGFRDLLAWLRKAGMTQICVIDNASTFPPLIDFYANSEEMRGVQLVHAGSNLGYGAMWKLGLHHLDSVARVGRYILTDPDLVPDPQCPLDLVRRMHEIADRYSPAKVGPAIRIDNIPDCFAQRDHMRRCEAPYWLNRVDDVGWDAPIDTTFAIYQAGWERWPHMTHGARYIRLGFPYVVNHIPWYEDSANPTEEALYYRAHVASGFSSSCMVPKEAAR